ncbi:MAG TPA: hypothetical protein VLA00_16130 [Xanthobacteraceae bacterium]|nr:hypothetical protein [Xanthobacteraceae bacterium]
MSRAFRKLVAFAILLAPLMAAPAAHADKAAAKACAAGLDADGQTIYGAVQPKVVAGVDLRTVVTDTTRSLVMGGSVSRANARPAAMAAGQCLELILN